jgi:hypothetical protein
VFVKSMKQLIVLLEGKLLPFEKQGLRPDNKSG